MRLPLVRLHFAGDAAVRLDRGLGHSHVGGVGGKGEEHLFKRACTWFRSTKVFYLQVSRQYYSLDVHKVYDLILETFSAHIWAASLFKIMSVIILN